MQFIQLGHLIKLVQPCVHPATHDANLVLLLGVNRLVAADEVQEGLRSDVGASPEPAVVRDARLAHSLLNGGHGVVEVDLASLVVKKFFLKVLMVYAGNFLNFLRRVFKKQSPFILPTLAWASHWILKLVKKWLATATSASFGQG